MENKTRVQLERLLYALVKHDRQAIDDIYEQVEAIDLAEEIEECSHIDDEKLAEILEESEEELQTDIIDYLDNKRVLSLFSYMSKDNIVDILGDLPIGKRKNLINLMKADDKRIIEQLLGYDEDSAGGLMTTEYIALD